ncbi:MAG: hypothetical protein JXB03_01660, partial [Spirochaetales bacterium]|nr:hypothetical protein [Spirochaetales bacterium]
MQRFFTAVFTAIVFLLPAFSEDMGTEAVFDAVLSEELTYPQASERLEELASADDLTVSLRARYFHSVLAKYAGEESVSRQIIQTCVDDIAVSQIAGPELTPEQQTDFYLLTGDIYNQMAQNLRGFNALSYARKAKNSFETALVHDPENAWAALGLSLYLFHAPGIAGGSREVAMGMLKELAGSAEHEPQLRYMIHLWLFITARETGDTALERKGRTVIDEMYPDNMIRRGIVARYEK